MTDPSGDADRITLRLDELEAGLQGISTDLADLAAAVIPEPGGNHAPDAEVPVPAFATLDAWVTEYFAVVFSRSIGGEIRWCPLWSDHPEALTRLEALWRSWETMRLDPNLGMATWLTNHLDPQLGALLSRSGTFAQCGLDRHQAIRKLPTGLKS